MSLELQNYKKEKAENDNLREVIPSLFQQPYHNPLM